MNIEAQIKDVSNRYDAIRIIKDAYADKQLGLKMSAIVYDMYMDFGADIDKLVNDDNYFDIYWNKYVIYDK